MLPKWAGKLKLGGITNSKVKLKRESPSIIDTTSKRTLLKKTPPDAKPFKPFQKPHKKIPARRVSEDSLCKTLSHVRVHLPSRTVLCDKTLTLRKIEDKTYKVITIKGEDNDVEIRTGERITMEIPEEGGITAVNTFSGASASADFAMEKLMEAVEDNFTEGVCPGCRGPGPVKESEWGGLKGDGISDELDSNPWGIMRALCSHDGG